MKKASQSSSPAQSLRARAEAALGNKATHVIEPLSLPQARRLIYELELHQVELEMQNDELMRARAEIEAGLTRYTELYDFAPVGYFTLTRDGTVRAVNLAGAALLGLERSRLVGCALGSFVAAESRPVFKALLGQAFQTGTKACGELELHLEAGHSLWVRLELAVPETRQEAHAAALDITERRRTEAALRASEAQYRRIVETADEGIWVVDPDWNTTFVNARLADMFGLRPEEMLGRHLFDFMDSANRNAAEPLMVRREQGVHEKHDFQFRRADRTTLWAIVSATPLMDARGQFLGGLAMVTDITSRKHAEDALHASQERYRTLAENTSDVIARFDHAYRHLYMNPAVTRLTGLSPAACLGKTHRELGFPRDQCDLWEATLERAFANGRPVHENVDLDGPRGRLCFDWWLYPEHDAAGRVVSVLSNMHDLTERRRVEDELRARETQLRQLNATKDKFFSIIAHDLKNPLNTFGMGLALLRDRPPEEQEALVAELQEDAQRLRQLLENLLTWARLEQGQLIPNCFTFDLRHMIDETLALITPLAAHKQIVLSAAPSPGPLSIRADETMLQTVVRNLLTNALKFTKPGGSVTISARECGDTTEIVVADTGIGIPPDELEQLFRIDAKRSRSGTRAEEGTGLGLILCQEFVKQHGGTIRLESEEENGTRAIVRLPRTADGAPAPERSASEKPLNPNGTVNRAPV